MQLVRGNPPLNRWVLQLRDNGLSWREVKAAIAEKKKERDAINRMYASRHFTPRKHSEWRSCARNTNDLCVEIAAAGVLDAFDQRRPACFEDVASVELYDQGRPPATAARRLRR